MQLFYCYSHNDEHHRERLETALAPLQREGVLEGWHDRCIVPGSDWSHEVDRKLDKADLVAVLLSPDFLASESCYAGEAARAIERHQSGTAWVLPILVRPVDWARGPFARFQALPKNARPVSRWRDPDAAWLDVAQGIRRAISFLQERRSTKTPPPPEVAQGPKSSLVYLYTLPPTSSASPTPGRCPWNSPPASPWTASSRPWGCPPDSTTRGVLA